ncbi:MAG: hypothetical protein AAGD25_28270 [Cyanobacteria bacterium P01_F01_bin.150]
MDNVVPIVQRMVSVKLSPVVRVLCLPDKKLLQAKLHELFADGVIAAWEAQQEGES